MTDDEVNLKHRSRFWFWIQSGATGFAVLITLVLGALLWRNNQQWNQVSALARSVKEAGGRCTIDSHFGTDFWRLWRPEDGSRRRMFSWPTVHYIGLPPESRPAEIDWKRAEDSMIVSLTINHPDFGDEELAAIPDTVTIQQIELGAPQITDASVPRLRKILYGTSGVANVDTKLTTAGLVNLLQGKGTALHTRLTTADLKSFDQANMLRQLFNFQVQADPSFRVTMLKGTALCLGAAFEGEIAPEAFANAADCFPNRSLVKFKDAKISPQALTELSKTRISTLFVVATKVTGDPPASATARGGEKLTVLIDNSTISPAHLRGIGRPIELYCIGNLVDDAWLDEVMKLPQIQYVVLWESQVSEDALARYPWDRPGVPYARNSNGPPDIYGKDFFDEYPRR